MQDQCLRQQMARQSEQQSRGFELIRSYNLQYIITTFVKYNNKQQQDNPQQSMNSRFSNLPNLNSQYIHLKAYAQHRKKVQEIMRSRSRQKNKMKTQISKLGSQQKESEVVAIQQIAMVKKSRNNKLKRQLSPRANRNLYEIQKENNRLLERIHKCSSTINRKEILEHSRKSLQIKNQLSRFIYQPHSHKVILRCKQSLEILRKRQLEILEHSYSISRKQSRVRYAKSQASNIQTYGVSDTIIQSNSTSKKSLQHKLYLLQHGQKIKKHSERSKFQQVDTKQFQTLKFNFWNKAKKGIETRKMQKSRIFSTEIED